MASSARTPRGGRQRGPRTGAKATSDGTLAVATAMAIVITRAVATMTRQEEHEEKDEHDEEQHDGQDHHGGDEDDWRWP